MKVRRGKTEDIPGLVALFKEFWEASGFSDAGIKFSSGAIAALLSRSLADRGIVVVAESDGELLGYALAAVVPFPFNPKASVVTELSVYAKDPKVRAQLDKKARQVGGQLGASAVCTADLQVRALA